MEPPYPTLKLSAPFSFPSDHNMKLFINTKEERVVFTEADKDFMDNLFGYLFVPLATMVNITSASSPGEVESLTNVYESIENLSDEFLLPNVTKDTLLSVMKQVVVSFLCDNKLIKPSLATKNNFYYGCPNHNAYVSANLGARCLDCWECMKLRLTIVTPTPCDIYTEAKSLRMKDEGECAVDVNDLQEKVVCLGRTSRGGKNDESNTSVKTVLTDVYIEKKESKAVLMGVFSGKKPFKMDFKSWLMK